MSSVSFVIPVYNKERYLKFVINSLKNQTGNYSQEFIFINDGSTDNSLELIKSETKKWKNCKIINQKNMGSAGATNVGIKLAKNKYIKFLDADDLLMFSATSSLVQILEKNDDCILAYGLQRKVEDLSTVDLKQSLDTKKTTKIYNPIKLAMKNSMFNPSQFLVKTSFCKKVEGCDERVKHSQEYSLTLRLSLLGNFIKLNQYTAVLPFSAPGQISEKKVNQLHRVSRALEYFINDNKNIEFKYKKFAQRRLTGRAWRFAKRHYKAGYFSSWFMLYLRGLFGLSKDIKKTCSKANSVYKDLLD